MKSLHPSEGHSQERARDLKKEPAAQSLYSLQPADEPANQLLIRLADAIDAADDLATEYDQEHETDCDCHFCCMIGRRRFYTRADIIDDVRFAHETLARLKSTFDNIVIRDKPAADPVVDVLARSPAYGRIQREYESDGATVFRSIVTALESGRAACEQFTARHADGCTCAFCDRGGCNYHRNELRREIDHIGHALYRFLDSIKLEGAMHPDEVINDTVPQVIAARVQADLPEELQP